MSRFEEIFTAQESGLYVPDSSASVKDLNLTDLLEEIPVSLNVFIQDKKYLGMSTIQPSPIQAEAIEHIERIYFPKMYPAMAEHDPYWAKPHRLTNYHAMEFGKGGGKDFLCRMAFLRIAYLFLCLKSPQGYYRIPDDDDVHMLNVAKSAQQAGHAFFNPLKKNVKRGWFKDKADPTKYEIVFDKNLVAISGHSQAESQEGLNLLLGICDEIDAFKTKADVAKGGTSAEKETSNTAEYIMNMMRSSGRTRFPQVFKQVYISYPRAVGSPIQVQRHKGEEDFKKKGSGSNWYTSGPHATWVANPLRTKEEFADEYEEDFIEAEAKYECKPRHAADPYFKNFLAVEACVRKDEEPAITVEYVTDGKQWTPVYTFREDFYPIAGARYAMHADLALWGDRAGVAMSHVVKVTEEMKNAKGEHDEIIQVPEQVTYVKTDFIVAYEADTSHLCVPPREIQMRWARDLWAELKLRGFSIVQFSYDGYQSAESRQEMERLGVASPLISTDRSEEPWKTLRDLMQSGRISLPEMPLLMTELFSLTKKPNGKVDHQTYSSKDCADALACSATGAIMVGGREDPLGTRAYYAAAEFIMGGDDSPKFYSGGSDLESFGLTSHSFHDQVSGYDSMNSFGSEYF